MRRLIQELRQALQERAVPFVKGDVEKLRKDFLLLMKNVPKVANYKDAIALKEAIRIWNSRFEILIFKQLVGLIPTAVKARVGDGFASTQADGWAKEWEEKIRKGCWGLHIEFRLPIEDVHSDYMRKYQPDATEEGMFYRFDRDRKKWEAKVKRAAQAAWKVLKEYLDWLGETPQKIDVPDDEQVELEGFKVRIFGSDKADETDFLRKSVPILKEALKIVRERGNRVFPWIVKNMLPMTLRFIGCGLDWAGQYGRDHIRVCAWSMDDPRKAAHVVIHEMGHHVWQAYLSGQAQKFWESAIAADRGQIDLVKLAEIWRKVSPEGHLSDLDKYLAEHDPIMLLQVETMTHGYGNYGKSVFFSLEELEKLITSGKTTYPVPQNPITAYAEKNPEEAFCEAFGRLTAYGPRAVLPEVRGWLKIILPELRVESVLRDLTRELREALASAPVV